MYYPILVLLRVILAYSGDNFMHGLYKLFIGDARPHSENDEWVFADVDSIKEFIIPASRTALKVHQVPTQIQSLPSVLLPLG